MDKISMNNSIYENVDRVYKLNMQQKSKKKRPHFTINWRQLTYCHYENNSVSNLFRWNKKRNSKQKLEENENNNNNNGKKLILNSLDGCFKSGQLSAILGPSGAGKSTFLSALFGNKQESSFGQTKVNWYEDSQHQCAIDSHIKQRPIKIAFLPQQDHLLNHLSVYETLMFASKIKNASRLNELQLSEKNRLLFHRSNVRRVAKMLKLLDCLQTRCGQLSGGQYKRVSIGQELLSEPDVIILDEPTSGLDAMTCLTTVRTLKSIACKHPISIILTIHQPDIDVFNLFDHIYVIAQGGRAIYEGKPNEMVETLKRANLHMPTSSYNPARFIVENAFLSPLEAPNLNNNNTNSPLMFSSDEDEEEEEEVEEEKGRHDDDDKDNHNDNEQDDNDDDDEVFVETREELDNDASDQYKSQANVFKRSLLSLTDAIASSVSVATSGEGKSTTNLNLNSILTTTTTSGKNSNKKKRNKFRESGRKPLLNFGGIKTSDGKLIETNNQLLKFEVKKVDDNDDDDDYEQRDKLERLKLLKRLNYIQKSKYYDNLILNDKTEQVTVESHSSCTSTTTTTAAAAAETNENIVEDENNDPEGHKHKNSFIINLTTTGRGGGGGGGGEGEKNFSERNNNVDRGINMSSKTSGVGSTCANSYSSSSSSCKSNSLRTTSGLSSSLYSYDNLNNNSSNLNNNGKLRRQFDKRLNAKHNNSKQNDNPIIYHSLLLTHRTWLSIVRDPIFFGIQFCMHTTIPILLAFIFGFQQEEGCPRIGQFDLVEFAYQNESNDFIKGTMQSIRQSMGNIGVIFFEMFVLSFAINCITALVFPLDMYVLSKEYRNGWYSLQSYFIGRTLADLPIPIALHSMAMTILYYMTGQPLEWWRFSAIILIVIISSLVAQSVGLTIGALLMQSSQSAVLAAAGIVAPFFALSGFIVRIHTLPFIAQLAAQGSYLYHLLNGFIILRYGFGRCHCDESDFEPNDQHKIPNNLRTMASIWIGTYSNEYETLQQQQQTDLKSLNDTTTLKLQPINNHSRTNIDPNIDLVDKLTGAFKMANSYGHKVESCNDALPYAMLDFNLRDNDIWASCFALLAMLLITRLITFGAIYYKIRSFA